MHQKRPELVDCFAFFMKSWVDTLATLDQKLWRTDLQVVNNVEERALTARTLKSYVIEDGVPGVKEA